MRYVFGEIIFDTDARQLSRRRDAIHLSPKAQDLLVLLIAERHRVVPKQEIFDKLWPRTFVVEANLANLIVEIRRAVGDAGHQIIRTVHGTGYSFAAPVQERRKIERDATAYIHMLVYEKQQLRLSEGENVVGREPTADVFLASGSVSRRHALITVSAQEATLADLDSKHGTFLGAEPVRSEVPLSDGNLLRFGKVEVQYRRWAGADPTDSFLEA